LDVELPSRECFGEPLQQAIRRGRIREQLVDRAVRRVLGQKFRLGLFERPTVEAEVAGELFDTGPQRELARRLAVKSLVLLKNEGGFLPLSPHIGTLAVIGPNADSIRNLQGDYCYPAHLEVAFGPVREPGQKRVGDDEYQADLAPGRIGEQTDLLQHFTPTVSVLEGIRAAVSAHTRVLFARGCDLRDTSINENEQAVAVAGQAEVAVVVVGGRSGLLPDCTSGEAVDAARLELTGAQARLVDAVAATGVPTAVVLVNGRILALENVVDSPRAILQAWLPGEEGATPWPTCSSAAPTPPDGFR
jgi:beta-glucosidase